MLKHFRACTLIFQITEFHRHDPRNPGFYLVKLVIQSRHRALHDRLVKPQRNQTGHDLINRAPDCHHANIRRVFAHETPPWRGGGLDRSRARLRKPRSYVIQGPRMPQFVMTAVPVTIGQEF